MATLLQAEVEYPESDGQPLAETGFHVRELADLYSSLDLHFLDVPCVYVAANMFLYYAEGDPNQVVAPDLYVTKGVSKQIRRTYKLWEEGRPPCMVIELTSNSSRDEDLYQKKDCYTRIGVEEYFIFDVLSEYLDPQLQGFRLENGHYLRMEADSDGSLECRTLGLKLRVEGDRLRLIDAATGEPLLRANEVFLKARREEEARKAAEAARKAEVEACTLPDSFWMGRGR